MSVCIQSLVEMPIANCVSGDMEIPVDNNTMSPAIIKNKYKYLRKREPGLVQIFTQMTCKIKVGNLQKCNFIILKIKPQTSSEQHFWQLLPKCITHF